MPLDLFSLLAHAKRDVQTPMLFVSKSAHPLPLEEPQSITRAMELHPGRGLATLKCDSTLQTQISHEVQEGTMTLKQLFHRHQQVVSRLLFEKSISGKLLFSQW